MLAHHEVTLLVQAVAGVSFAGVTATTFSLWSTLRHRLADGRSKSSTKIQGGPK